MLYFAYGSNMNWQQMQERCPSARFVAIAVLPDHKLAFTRKSKQRNCGVADAVAAAGQNVWGVVYEIGELEVGDLDASEGYRAGRQTNGYWRRECMVSRDGDEKRPLTVWTYFAQPEPNPPLPDAEYKNSIVSGARYWHLPEEYIRELESIEVSG